MHLIIRATESQQQELLQKGFGSGTTITWIEENQKLYVNNADAFFDLTFNDNDVAPNEIIHNNLVFVHGVNCICAEINHPNYIRLNAWNGFINRDITEIACCNAEWKHKAENILNTLCWKYVWTEDDYGFIAARIIAMIINEAYYALQENVSTKEQIDTAMKLGTNYPFGPFEWSERIGLNNVFNLLKRLAVNNNRYSISGLLVHECQQY